MCFDFPSDQLGLSKSIRPQWQTIIQQYCILLPNSPTFLSARHQRDAVDQPVCERGADFHFPQKKSGWVCLSSHRLLKFYPIQTATKRHIECAESTDGICSIFTDICPRSIRIFSPLYCFRPMDDQFVAPRRRDFLRIFDP